MVISNRNLLFQRSIFRCKLLVLGRVDGIDFKGTKYQILLREFPGTPRNGTPFWEASHTIPINSWKFMGSLWEPYGKGVLFFGAPGNSIDTSRNNDVYNVYILSVMIKALV